MHFAKWTIFTLAMVSLLSCGASSSDGTTKVYKDDEKVQCETSNIALEEMATELTGQGIDVLCSQKGNDGEPKDLACGLDQGSINIYVIHVENEQDATKLGFLNVSTLPEYKDSECI